MEKILDRMEAIVRRWYYLVCIAILLLSVVLSISVHMSTSHETPLNLPEGSVYCPSCGTVMVLERKVLDE